jgi:hypothetical protein
VNIHRPRIPRRLRSRPRAALALVLLLGAIGSVAIALPAVAASGSWHCSRFVYGLIEDKYAQLGAEAGQLGCPTDTEADDARGGRWEPFTNGFIFYNPDPAIGTHAVIGAIARKWTEYGREILQDKGLGYPLTDETMTPDRIGRYSHFERGSIYWSPSTGAHVVRGFIWGKWADPGHLSAGQHLGWERSFLGYPVTDELDLPDGTGKYNDFQNGRISWTPAGGAKVTLEQLTFDWRPIPLDSNVGGWTHLTIRKGGTYNFSGHFHNSDPVFSFKTGVFWLIRATSTNETFGFTDKSSVGGTVNPFGDPDHDWSISGTYMGLKEAWPDLEKGVEEGATAKVGFDLGGFYSDIKKLVGIVKDLKDVVGSATG